MMKSSEYIFLYVMYILIYSSIKIMPTFNKDTGRKTENDDEFVL